MDTLVQVLFVAIFAYGHYLILVDAGEKEKKRVPEKRVYEFVAPTLSGKRLVPYRVDGKLVKYIEL